VEKEAELLRCKSAASHHICSSQQLVFMWDRLIPSVMNPPEGAAGA